MQTTKKWTSKGPQAQGVRQFNSAPTNLIINYLPKDMLEDELLDMFSTFGDIRKVKIVHNSAGESMGYGFVDFVSPRAASCAQILVNATEIRGKRLKVAFAKPRSKDTAKANLFVQFLPPNVDEAELETLFESYGKIEVVKIVRDRSPRAAGPLNVAYVRFEQHLDAQRARSDLDGFIFNGATQPISVQTARGSRRADSDDAHVEEETPYFRLSPRGIPAEASKSPHGFIFEDSPPRTIHRGIPAEMFKLHEGIIFGELPQRTTQAEASKPPNGFIFEDSPPRTIQRGIPAEIFKLHEGIIFGELPQRTIQAEAAKRPNGFIFKDSPPRTIKAEASNRHPNFIFTDSDEDLAIEEAPWVASPPPKIQVGFIFEDSPPRTIKAKASNRHPNFIFTDSDEDLAIEEAPWVASPPTKIQVGRPHGFIFEDSQHRNANQEPRGFIFEDPNQDHDMEMSCDSSQPIYTQAEAIFTDSESD